MIGTATDELESGRVGNVGKKCKNGKIELCFVMHKSRTTGNVGNKGKKGNI